MVQGYFIPESPKYKSIEDQLIATKFNMKV